jgi:hypothetical protein
VDNVGVDTEQSVDTEQQPEVQIKPTGVRKAIRKEGVDNVGVDTEQSVDTEQQPEVQIKPTGVRKAIRKEGVRAYTKEHNSKDQIRAQIKDKDISTNKTSFESIVLDSIIFDDMEEVLDENKDPKIQSLNMRTDHIEIESTLKVVNDQKKVSQKDTVIDKSEFTMPILQTPKKTIHNWLQDSEDNEVVVNINIGRIDVHSNTRNRILKKRLPALSLNDYLIRRSKGT